MDILIKVDVGSGQRVNYNTMTITETNKLARLMLHDPGKQREYFVMGMPTED